MDKLSKVFLALSAIGIPVSIYHAYDEITNYSSGLSKSCNISNFISCTKVFDSGYTKFLGLSLWVYGIVWFPFILALGYWLAKSGTINGLVMVPVLLVGDIFTIYLWYLELDKIHAICPVCVSLYVLNYVMTAVAVGMTFRQE